MRHSSKGCVVKKNVQKSNATQVNFNPKNLPPWQRTPPLTREKRAQLLQYHRERHMLEKKAEAQWKRTERNCLKKLLQLQKELDDKQEKLYIKEREMLMSGRLKSPVLPANPAPWGFASPGIPRYFPTYCEKEDPSFPRGVKEEEEKMPKP